MPARTLVAYANGRRVGTVSDDSGIWSFTYDNDWLGREDAFALSPAFPLTAEPVIDGSSQRPVQWFFDNLLIGNADSHLKNLSFFVSPRGYVLAPFYDLVCTVVYHTPTYQPQQHDRWPRCDLTMPIGEATQFADISRKNMLAFGEVLRLTPKGAERLLDDMLATLDARVMETRRAVDEIAQPNAGEVRLLDSIIAMPLAEMSAALRK